MPTPLVVSEEILLQIDEVRETGDTNMADRTGVQVVANGLGLYALVIYAEDARHTWASVMKEYGDWRMGRSSIN